MEARHGSNKGSEEQLRDFKEYFSLFDRDGDGLITLKELEAVMKSMGLQPSAAELKAMIESVDTDQSGAIDCDEFIQMMDKHISWQALEPDLRKAWQLFDRGNSGRISLADLREVLTKAGDPIRHEDLDEMIREANLDGDGHISFPAFVKLMTGT
ncbi:calmodulin-like 3 [Balamuthia mandrillaris]